jgi:hypothetical protein
MKILFYSEECNYCKKLLDYINNNNLNDFFKLIDINKNEVPEIIDIVPTIIDTDLNQPLKSEKAYEYIINLCLSVFTLLFLIPVLNLDFFQFYLNF